MSARALSPSARRAWIEIETTAVQVADVMVALRKEGVDRNLFVLALLVLRDGSPSARRAWIEIAYYYIKIRHKLVALRKEGVDRNYIMPRTSWMENTVALRKEGVDRNRSIRRP